jgi:ABC-2 type transport system ATP-binding protein
LIQVRELSKAFGGRPAVKGVSFTVARGEILGFLGPNGAGKTTTMRILSCYMPADSGSALLDGLDLFDSSMEVRRRIGYLPESPPLYREMIVGDYLDFVARIRAIARKERRSRVASAIERCGLGEVRGRLIGNLSKGYRQRVGLAQALVHDPPILILDEPTVGLDPEQIVEIRELIRSLGGDHTVILSTHILSEVAVTCSRVAIISHGSIVQEGSLEGLAASGADHEQVRLRLSRDGDQMAEALGQIPWVLGVARGGERGTYTLSISREARAREELARSVVERGWGLLELTPLARTIEEIYLDATRGLPQRGAGAPPARAAVGEAAAEPLAIKGRGAS